MARPVLSRQARDVARRIRLQSRRQVEQVFAGAWQSAFHGAGLDFRQVREYVPGDDLRRVDPMSSARTGRWYVREFQEERQQQVQLLLDVSASTRVDSASPLRERMAELAGILALAAVTNGDTCGAVLLAEQVEEVIRPRHTEGGALALIPRILEAGPEGAGTSLSRCLHQARAFLPRRALVFLISDFLDAGFEPSLRALASRHDVVLVGLLEEFGPLSRVRARLALRDPEQDGAFALDLVRGRTRQHLARAVQEREPALAEVARRAGAEWMPLRSEASVVAALQEFLARRTPSRRLR